VREAAGYTRVFVHPGRGVHAVDGLLTGLHDPVTSHLAMLAAFAGMPLMREAYAEAIAKRYLWHEFGDSHLILLERRIGPAS
jgi:S-adenosylmethionine:tRNA ribosyltransferase-isomerase